MSQTAGNQWTSIRLRALPEMIRYAWYFQQWSIVYIWAVEHDEEIAKICKRRGVDEQQIIVQVADDEVILISEVYAKVAEWGNTGLLTICKNRGLVDINRAMIIGAKNGSQGIMRLCKMWGATNVNDAMLAAIRVKDIIFCKELGADAFEDLAVRPAFLNRVTVLQLCKKWGMKDFGPAIEAAQRYSRDRLIAECELFGARL